MMSGGDGALAELLRYYQWIQYKSNWQYDDIGDYFVVRRSQD